MAKLDKQEFTFEGDHKTRLFARLWLADPAQGGVILMIHGIGEHSGRYEPLAAEFNRRGYHVIALDLRGHGRSEGTRGHTPSFESWMTDISCFIEAARQQVKGSVWCLYGHSLGGNLALNYLLRRNAGLHAGIVTSPELRLAFTPPRWKHILAVLMNGLWPSFIMSSGLDANAISHASLVIQDYRRDPLVHDRISPRTYISFLRAGEWAIEHARSLMQPVLLMHGETDRITSAAASAEFASRAQGLCRYISWPDAYHELHHEIPLKELVGIMTDWLEEQYPQLAGRYGKIGL